MKKQMFKKGYVIIKEGSFGKCAYIVESGKVEVSKTVDETKTVFLTLGNKQIFGEMGLIEDKPRSATVTALVDSELSVLNRDEFNELFNSNRKIILPIIKALFERLRIATATITADAETEALELAKEKEEHEEQMREMDDEMILILSGTNDISWKALNDMPLEIVKLPFKVGRSEAGFFTKPESILATENDLNIYEDSPPYYVSINHFLIDKVHGEYIVVDRGSHSGLVVNNSAVKDACVLHGSENEIIVGSSFSPFVFNISIKCRSSLLENKDNDENRENEVLE